MKKFFNKSFPLMLFAGTVSFVLIFGTALFNAIIQRMGADVDIGDLIIVPVAASFLILLLFLNASDVLNYWLREKTKQIKIKHIVGIQQGRIYLSIYLNLNMLILTAFLMGVVCSRIVAKVFTPIISIRLTLASVLAAMAFCALFLNAFFTLLVIKKLKNGFMRL